MKTLGFVLGVLGGVFVLAFAALGARSDAMVMGVVGVVLVAAGWALVSSGRRRDRVEDKLDRVLEEREGG